MSLPASPTHSPPPPSHTQENIISTGNNPAIPAPEKDNNKAHQSHHQLLHPRHHHQIDPALSGPAGDPRASPNGAPSSNAPPPHVPLTYHPNPYHLDGHWQQQQQQQQQQNHQQQGQQQPSSHNQAPGFSAAVFQPGRYHQPHHPPPPHSQQQNQPHHHHHQQQHHPDPYSHMPHRVDSQDRPAALSHRPEDRPYEQHPNASHPSPPPIAALHNSTPTSADDTAAIVSSITSPSPPLNQSPYYATAPPQNGPGMHSSYSYAPHARYAPQGDPNQHGAGGGHPMPPPSSAPYPPSSHYGPPPVGAPVHLNTRAIRPTYVTSSPPESHPYYTSQSQPAASPSSAGSSNVQPSYIVHTDDAATKLNDRVRRKCYNCRTTDTSTWRRSSLTPGKVLCNKCGLFERTHSRPRPEQFPHKRGPIVTTTFKSSRSPPPPSSRLPPMNAQQQQQQQVQQQAQQLPPHHYDHPSIAPLMPRQDGGPQQQYVDPNASPAQNGSGSPATAANGNANGRGDSNGSIGSLLNSPNAAAASQQQQQVDGASTNGNGSGSGSVGQSGNGNSLKRPLSPGSPGRSPRQEQRTPPYMYQQRSGANA